MKQMSLVRSNGLASLTLNWGSAMGLAVSDGDNG